MIKTISFKNYKIFKSKQTLELKPITIVIGKNNSGKSAVVKLPTMIAGSLRGKFSDPLKPENDDISLGSSYEDLVYNRNIVDVLEFDMSNKSESLSVSTFGDRNNKIFFSKYILNDKEIDTKANKFKGFTLEANKFKTLHLNYDYVGPFRRQPAINYPHNSNEYSRIGIEGENAYPILIQMSENKNPTFEKISQWYKDNFEGWGLKVSQIVGSIHTYDITLSHDNLNLVNLRNVGQGIHQALPLIVRSYMPAEKETLIIIEEPETHLHPAAHGGLAQRFVDSLEDKNKSYLIETHSQNFVLRMRRLVAEGKLDKDDLAIYYVHFDEFAKESFLKKIEVDNEGEVIWWPEGIFSESLNEVIEIRNAQNS